MGSSEKMEKIKEKQPLIIYSNKICQSCRIQISRRNECPDAQREEQMKYALGRSLGTFKTPAMPRRLYTKDFLRDDRHNVPLTEEDRLPRCPKS